MSDVSLELLVSLGDVAAEPVEQNGPTSDFIYVDISSVDRETKRIVHAKTIIASEAPSRAKQVLRTGDVVISMTRPNLNAVALIPDHLDGAIGSTGFHVLRSRWIKPQFLFGLVQTDGFIDAMCDVVQGALYPAVRPRDIAAFKFNLQSINQQTRIVEKLEELLSDLDAGVAELKAAQKKLGQYRQSLLKAVVEGALTAEWRAARKVGAGESAPETGAQLLARILLERRARWEAKQLAKFESQGKAPPKDWQKKYPEPVQPDTADLPELPEGWVWASIDQLTAEQKYGSSSKTNEDSTGVPILRMGNIQDGDLDFSNLKYLPADHDEFPGLYLQDGDLLFNRTNSPELVGKTAVYRSQVSPCSFASYLISVRFSQSYIPELASTFINSAYGKHWIKSVVVQQVGQANVNGSKLAALAIPLPPLEEQKEIVSSLQAQTNEIVEQLKNVDTSLKQSAAQRKNILKAAFSGQLVPQDPIDEPASVLLERIRAERAEREKRPKIRKTKQQKEIAAMVSKLMDVLVEAGDWLPAQEAFRRCGVADGAQTEQLEALYAELRALDKAGRLAVEPVTDTQGRKLHDRLKLLAA
ncbi:restriction endonuclease subunit S [Sulfuriferula sp.]|uniref:restriction endonuclease subunit S n=1 Tax=Sulfuriferula sp. TaxID=2025307 RepID=UPI00273207F9|nr:restriction endonuclease subunit S [Sulfuriferula sp.]MDP2025707.1 restriction endonuclease subunit S [Sulfuriferula sp.]